MLVGIIDHPDLHYAIRDERGGPGSPVARLTPLGWTCMGGADRRRQHTANFYATLFISCTEKELNTTLQKFWELETSGIVKQEKNYTQDEKEAVEQMEKLTSFENGRCEVKMPWKITPYALPDAYSVAQ